jgi:hypothetical protein
MLLEILSSLIFNQNMSFERKNEIYTFARNQPLLLNLLPILVNQIKLQRGFSQKCEKRACKL